MMDIYIMRTDIFLEKEAYERGCRETDTVRLAKAEACKKAEDKARSLCCGLLLQYAVRRYLGVKERVEIRYGYGKYGKPYLEEYPGLHFSLSHSGSFACCVFADREVGIDLQEARPMREGLAGRILSEQEYARYGNMALREEKEDWLCRCWCAKESYMKLTGEGLAGDFRRVCLEPEGRRILPDGICREYRPAGGYYMNACVREDAGDPGFPGQVRDVTREAAVTVQLF